MQRWGCTGNSVDPDQTAPEEQSDLGLHYSLEVMSKYISFACKTGLLILCFFESLALNVNSNVKTLLIW